MTPRSIVRLGNHRVIKLPQEVFSRPGLAEKIMAIAQSAPPLLAGAVQGRTAPAGGVKRGEGAHMSVVLVHGNPETIAVWDPLRDALDRDDIVCLSPPGFGAPVPDGWGATVEDYRDWLIYEL